LLLFNSQFPMRQTLGNGNLSSNDLNSKDIKFNRPFFWVHLVKDFRKCKKIINYVWVTFQVNKEFLRDVMSLAKMQTNTEFRFSKPLNKMKTTAYRKFTNLMSILERFLEKLLQAQIPKAQKKTDNLTVFFAPLGSACIKAAHKM